MNENDYEAILRRSGLKNTRQRAAILSVLEQGDSPLAAEDVYVKIRRDHVSVNLSTVYRTLETMAERDIIKKIGIVGDGRAHFEFNRKIHRHYLVCLGCKKIVAINHCPLEGYLKTVERETRYSLQGHKLDIYGYCPECRNSP